MTIEKDELPEKNDRILCAAIWYKNLPLKEDDIPRDQMLPVNITEGVVFCGHRHLQCMRTMNAIYGLSDSVAGASVQGFLTQSNRFVDRNEGYDIAEAAEQVLHPKHTRYLFSEDLY